MVCEEEAEQVWDEMSGAKPTAIYVGLEDFTEVHVPSLQQRIGEWHRLRFPDADLAHVALKASEEVGELASAVLGEVGMKSATGSGNALKEAADVIVVVMALIERWYGDDLMAAVEEKLAVLNDPMSGHRASLKAAP